MTELLYSKEYTHPHHLRPGRNPQRRICSKARAYKGSIKIGKTLKNLDSICCPQCRETKANTLKQLRPIGEGDQELEKRLVREGLT
jgi:hypothetical protein